MEHKVVFITGSSSGIGRATALRFAKAGYAVVVSYFHDEEAGREVFRECREASAPEVLLVRLDVKEIQSIQTCVGDIMKTFGHIDILINNSGVAVKSLLVEQDLEIIHKQISTNLTGAILVTRACLPYLTTSLVMVGSNVALHGMKKMSVYSATKFGLRGFVQSLAQEYPKLNIHVVNPRLTATRSSNFRGDPPEVVADIIFQSAIGYYRVRSGGDINVWEYRYGRLIRYGILFIAFVKRIVKKMLGRSL